MYKAKLNLEMIYKKTAHSKVAGASTVLHSRQSAPAVFRRRRSGRGRVRTEDHTQFRHQPARARPAATCAVVVDVVDSGSTSVA